MHRFLLVACLVLPAAFGCQHEVHHATIAQQPQPVPVAQRQSCTHQPGPSYGPGGPAPVPDQHLGDCPPPPASPAVPPPPSEAGAPRNP